MARRALVPALLLAAAIGAGCQPDPPGPPVVTRAVGPPGETWRYACPAPGTRVEAVPQDAPGAAAVRVLGSLDPLDLTRCAVRVDGQAEQRWAFEAFEPGSAPARALAALMPAAPGDCAAAREGSLQTTGRGRSLLRDTLCFRGYETLEVGGRPRRVAVVTDTIEGASGDIQRAERILFYDVATRALVGSEFRLLRGLLPARTGEPGWRALRAPQRGAAGDVP